MNNFPDRLRAWRVSLGLSQARAAQALGVPTRTLQGWEGGREPLHAGLVVLAMRAVEAEMERADRAAEALGVEPPRHRYDRLDGQERS